MKTSTIVFFIYFILSSILLINSSFMKSNTKMKAPTVSLNTALFNFVTQKFFVSIDRNANGLISLPEFSDFIVNTNRAHGDTIPSNEVVSSTFRNIDTNNNGVVNIDELRAWFRRQNADGPVVSAALHVAFDKIDLNNDQQITADDIYNALSLFALNNNLGNINQTAVVGPFYSVLNTGETSFRFRHFQRMWNNLFVVAPQQAAQAGQNQAAQQSWPRTSLSQLLQDMLVNVIFQRIDTDHSGSISMNEWLAFNKQYAFSHGWPVPIESDLRLVFNLIDLDRSGSISLNEMRSYLLKASNAQANQKTFLQIASVVAFEYLDEDKSGKLSFQEFKEGISRYAQANQYRPPTYGEIQTAYNSVTQDGVFNVNDFKTLVAAYFTEGVALDSPQLPSAPQKLRNIVQDLLVQSLFYSIDINKSGSIDFNEFAKYSQKAALNKGILAPSLGKLRTLFNKIDTTNNGSISKAELKAYFSTYALVSGNPVSDDLILAVGPTYNILNSINDNNLSLEEWRNGIKAWARDRGLQVPSDETLNASWRHAMSLNNNFSLNNFTNLVANLFGFKR